MDLSYRQFLVTGGAGFLGSHLVDKLVAKGADVKVVDNLHSGNKWNLNKSMSKIHFIEGDVSDRSFVLDLVKGIEVVFHLAANASVPDSVKDPVYDYDVNALGTFNILEASRKEGVEKVVYASSAAIYGEPLYTPIDEEHPKNPISPYGASKLSGEIIGYTYEKTYGLPFVALRIFNVYGPRQRRYVMSDFIRKLSLNPGRLEVLGSGEQTRSYCYISDAVEGFLLTAEKGQGIYNLGNDKYLKIRELAEIITSKLSPNAKIVYTGQSWKGDIKILNPDISKIKKLGFKNTTPLHIGLDRLIEYERTIHKLESIYDEALLKSIAF